MLCLHGCNGWFGQNVCIFRHRYAVNMNFDLVYSFWIYLRIEFGAIPLIVVVSDGVPLVGPLSFSEIRKTVVSTRSWCGRAAVATVLTVRALSMTYSGSISVGTWLMSHSVLNFCAKPTNQLSKSVEGVSVLIMLTSGVFILIWSTLRKEWFSTAACSATSESAGLGVRTSHRQWCRTNRQ